SLQIHERSGRRMAIRGIPDASRTASKSAEPDGEDTCQEKPGATRIPSDSAIREIASADTGVCASVRHLAALAERRFDRTRTARACVAAGRAGDTFAAGRQWLVTDRKQMSLLWFVPAAVLLAVIVAY